MGIGEIRSNDRIRLLRMTKLVIRAKEEATKKLSWMPAGANPMNNGVKIGRPHIRTARIFACATFAFPVSPPS